MAEDMFRPPVNLAMKTLDRAFFSKKIPLSAARILNNSQISNIRAQLDRSKDSLSLSRCQNVRPDPSAEAAGKRCILLRPQINDEGQEWPWTPLVGQLEKDDLIKLIPYDLHLDYNYWTYQDISQAILPKDGKEEIPSGFQIVGHIAHLNLRDQWLPYKKLIGELILDKNTGIRTVINKTDDVGEENEYRTFKYELLAGEHDMNAEMKEQSCIFRFDYSKVYWNSRLNTEHERLVGLFKEGEAVCDVMAGIGPFALPAGKKRVFTWANDLNPESYKYLKAGVKLNKVQDFVQPFNENGHEFIRRAAAELARTDHSVTIKAGAVEQKKGPKAPISKIADKTLVQPKFFSHFVMNLPASAMDFLPDFVGLYDEETKALLPQDAPMPMVHCYCFDTKSDDNVEERKRICERISNLIGHTITPETPETVIWDVRDVSTNKRDFCASFRLPKEVAFRQRT
ncbi:Met-10+ like-protein-domain-containing protein [Elsinoe ampelina]|uniref:tRNA (guanine(37)-N1)-methyltransferase n=1 Tax=Elsinoe ampelina TaxID=302913 RepID=A0A6A6GIK0_9PEZI|nr:Met-10+ like-protein-domain-containing protein [Elsinoe ampelina]